MNVADDRWSVRGITRRLLPLLLVLTALELGGGLVLGWFETTLVAYPTLLVLVPVTIGTAGNLGSVLAARLSTAAHLGLLSLDPADERLAGSAAGALALAATVFPAVGAGAWLLARAAGRARLAPATAVGVALTSGLLLAAVAVVVTVAAAFGAYRTGADPDDVVVPVVTNVCDVCGIVVLVAVVEVLVR